MNHLEGVFVGCQEPLIAAPAFDEREAARLARRMCQRIDDILKEKSREKIPAKIRTEFSDTTRTTKNNLFF
jgi:hypothetical protein